MERSKGYILTREHLESRGQNLLRYIGVGDKGPFEIIITRERPLFFIQDSDELPGHLQVHERRSVDLTSFEDVPVDALYFNSQSQLYKARKHLQEMGIKTFEADILPEDRFLMERFVNGNVEIKGSCQLRAGLLRYTNPTLYPAEFQPRFSILSLDIETGQKGELYSIACHFEGREKEPDQPQTDPLGIVLMLDSTAQQPDSPAPRLLLNIELPGTAPDPLTDTGWMIRLPVRKTCSRRFLISWTPWIRILSSAGT